MYIHRNVEFCSETHLPAALAYNLIAIDIKDIVVM